MTVLMMNVAFKCVWETGPKSGKTMGPIRRLCQNIIIIDDVSSQFICALTMGLCHTHLAS
jgi:hypothetical protein